MANEQTDEEWRARLLDEAFESGRRLAWRAMLGQCLQELGVDDPEAGKARWVMEREATVAALRRACAEFGDNDWPDDLHLADVIEKHLHDHLPNR